MGYIISDITDACQLPLEVYWTDIGREYLIGKKQNRKKGIKVSYFSLGDSDCNYLVSDEPNNFLPIDFVPDITGDVDSCLKGTKGKIKSNLYLLPKHLIKTKQYTIKLIDNTNNSFNSCNINDLNYNIYINNVSIFNYEFNYKKYTGSDLIFLTQQDAQNYVDNNIKTNIKPEFINNVVFSVGINKNTNNTFTLFNPLFIITTNSFNDNVTDNSTSICGNNLKTTINFNSVTISNPNADVIEIENYSNRTTISGCDSVYLDCSAYYGIYAFSSVDMKSIWGCITSEFDGWVG